MKCPMCGKDMYKKTTKQNKFYCPKCGIEWSIKQKKEVNKE